MEVAAGPFEPLLLWFLVSLSVRLTATAMAAAANYGELQRTTADDRQAIDIQGERWRTLVN